MPLQIYKRGRFYWAKGWVEYNGRPIAGPYRRSTKASTEEGARDWINHETERQIRRYVVGDEPSKTFSDAIMLYNASPKAAKQLIPIVEAIGDLSLGAISGALLKSLGPKLKPKASTDTWWREIVTPASAVINNAHELEGTPLIRVKPYDKFERIAQDKRRGKLSRVERTPADKEWIEAFCRAADPYNAALVRFMFETAARIDQAVSLEPDDLRPHENKVRVKAQKGHPESWITVSPQMMDELLALPPKRPKNRKTSKLMKACVFGYGSSTGYNTRWKTICKRAGIPYLSAHPAGRHGFFTELVVRQGVDPVTAAKAGRWSDPNLPMRIYAHAETDEADIRARFRTNHVQDDAVQIPNSKKSHKE
ncbi:tyrosine-type recombinase/integrase [uncultured Shimia sp.]|uniref:tyrosine-type recombinase/integrase n=1 Tax=uncultured Shimia sp. TaxID=573152 RepID=UPI0026399A78|nr:tyrosine-type recombinase/integrase [uncultured Shimia sp.]